MKFELCDKTIDPLLNINLKLGENYGEIQQTVNFRPGAVQQAVTVIIISIFYLFWKLTIIIKFENIISRQSMEPFTNTQKPKETQTLFF